MENKIKIEKRKIVPIAAMVSAGKSKILNVLYNIKFLECRTEISTKFVNILRYNPNIKESRFYHLKVDKEGDDYTFYKDLEFKEIEGEKKIIEANKNINNIISNKEEINYQELFYMTEINEAPFFKDKEYLLTHDLCDIPGLSEYQKEKNKENKENIKIEENEIKENIKIKDNEIEENIKKEAENFGLIYETINEENFKMLINENNNNLIDIQEKEEDDIFYEINEANDENSYLTQIFKIIKSYIDGAIIVLNLDNYYFIENYELIAKLHKVIQKEIKNFLIILNKMDKSKDPEFDIEKCKSIFIKYFPKCKTFNINLNTFVPLSAYQLENELLMDKNIKYFFLYHWFNFVTKTLREKTISNISFIEHLHKILKVSNIKDEEIISEVERLNNNANIENINNELISIINELKKYFSNEQINIGIVESDFNDTKDDLLDFADIGENINPSYIIKMFYKLYKENKFTPFYSDETIKLLDYFTIKNEQKEETTLDIQTQLRNNVKIIKMLQVFTNILIESKLDLNEALSLIYEINNVNNYLNNYENIFIPFLGPSNAGKTTLLNGIIGKDILPTNLNECTKRGIIIGYYNIEDTILTKAYFQIKNNNGENIYKLKLGKIIAKGNEQVKQTLNSLNYEYTQNKDDFFYFIGTKIQLLDELKIEENFKNVLYLIDLPGYGTNNIFEKEVYKKILSISQSFVFVVRNSLIKENTNKNILESIFTQAKQQKSQSTSRFAKSCLFIFNNDNEQPTNMENLLKAEKDIKTIIHHLDNENINCCFFNAKYYSNYCNNLEYFSNLNNSLMFEYKNYSKYKENTFINFFQGESLSNKTYKNFTHYLNKQLFNKISSMGIDGKPDKNYKRNEKVEAEINKIYEKYPQYKGDDITNFEKYKNTLCILISFALDNIHNIKFLKESNIEKFKSLFLNQMNTISFEIQDDINKKINEVISILDLFFRVDILDKTNEIKATENFKLNIKNIENNLNSQNSEFQISIFKILKKYMEEISLSLGEKKQNFIEELKSKNLKKILEDINIELKNHLDELNKEIIFICENSDKNPLKIYNKAKNMIKDFSFNKIILVDSPTFKEYFSNHFGNKEENLANEILNEIIISSESLKNIFKTQGFVSWLHSLISNEVFLKKVSDMIVNTFIDKIKYILITLINEFERYIFNMIQIIKTRVDSATITFTEEQLKIWDSLAETYNDIRAHIIEIKFQIQQNK